MGHSIEASVERSTRGVVARLGAPGDAARIALSSSVGVSPVDDFLLPLLVVPAMATGDALHVSTPLSSHLLDRIPDLQGIYRTWFPGFHAIELTVTPRTDPVSLAPQRGTASFFSGGVDSFFTALELRDELDALVLVEGFDYGIGRGEEPDPHLVRERVGEAAACLGLDLIVVTTDLRRWSDHRVRWGDHYVGSALAGVALALGGSFSRIHIPSTHGYRDLFPYGTHPLTDPLWSSEHVQIRVHGADSDRLDKVARVARSEVALRTLRVCWENPAGAYNCGRCSKCVRTMVELWAVGALEACPTLPDDLTAELVTQSIEVSDASALVFASDVALAIDRCHGPEAEGLRRALRTVLS